MKKSVILVVEDDKNISRATAAMLELKGYEVYTADTLAAGRDMTEKHDPDLIVLDILLPDGNGLDYCRNLRDAGKGVRILFLSALNTHRDIVNGLKAGGDDYLAKPYLTEELFLRIEALLRRGRIVSEIPDVTGPLTWLRSSKQVYAGGDDLLLTPREYALLEYLCRTPGQYFSAEEIYKNVWNAERSDNSPVHNHIYSLRRRLEGTGVNIEFSRNRGYRVIINV